MRAAQLEILKDVKTTGKESNYTFNFSMSAHKNISIPLLLFSSLFSLSLLASLSVPPSLSLTHTHTSIIINFCLTHSLISPFSRFLVIHLSILNLASIYFFCLHLLPRSNSKLLFQLILRLSLSSPVQTVKFLDAGYPSWPVCVESR